MFDMVLYTPLMFSYTCFRTTSVYIKFQINIGGTFEIGVKQKIKNCKLFAKITNHVVKRTCN